VSAQTSDVLGAAEPLSRSPNGVKQGTATASAEVEIVVISDTEGRVVCKYSGPGHGTGWFTRLRLWLSRWL
jgi:hypothetical protein